MEYTGGSWKKTTSDQLGLSIMTWEIDGDSDYWVSHVQTEADANLIAAAPDMLKELKHLVGLLEPMESDGSLAIPGLATLNGAREAIAKAEGR